MHWASCVSSMVCMTWPPEMLELNTLWIRMHSWDSWSDPNHPNHPSPLDPRICAFMARTLQSGAETSSCKTLPRAIRKFPSLSSSAQVEPPAQKYISPNWALFSRPSRAELPKGSCSQAIASSHSPVFLRELWRLTVCRWLLCCTKQQWFSLS